MTRITRHFWESRCVLTQTTYEEVHCLCIRERMAFHPPAIIFKHLTFLLPGLFRRKSTLASFGQRLGPVSL